MTEPRWVEVLGCSELRPGAARAVRVDGAAIAIFADDEGRCLGAVDNRCPHEGYPLATGTVRNGMLTCAWHNWKFALPDGACVLGGEAVRAYPVRVEDGRIWIDVADPPREAVVAAAEASLAKAFDEDDWGHAARTVERMLVAGASIEQVVGFGVEWAATRAPYGFDHGPAATADLLALAHLWPDEPGAVVIQALQLMVQPHLRRPPRTVGGASRGEVSGTGLRALIEAEDVAGAEQIVLSAHESGVPVAEIFDWITAAATDHFYDFGHGHIFTVKAEELVARLEPARAPTILAALVASLAYGTREDTLPYMRAFGRWTAVHQARLGRVAIPAAGQGAELDIDRALAVVLDGTLEEALEHVVAALEAGVAPDRLALALALAAAHRILRFDAALEARDDVSEGWLDVTHSMTHAEAVRESVVRRPSVDSLRGILHSARFVQHLRPLDAADAAPSFGQAPDPAALAATVLDDRFTLPIFVAHHVKVAACAGRLYAAMRADPAFASRADVGAPVLAAAGLIGAHIGERRMTRRGRVARTFVREGRMQTKLLGY